MPSPTILMALTLVGVIALFGALAFFVYGLVRILGDVGGAPDSLLAKIRMGVRAIDTQTARLAPEVTRLNEGLTAVSDGMVRIDENLGGVIDAVSRQEAG